MAGEGEHRETNRDRVRRLLLGPLGFRSPKGTPPEAERALLDGVCDDLAYLTDADLLVLRDMLRVHGQGSARCFWPPRATFVGFAHVVRPRPVVQDPALLRWFGSIEGPRMIADGTVVETWSWFERYRRPPVTPRDRRLLADQAAGAARRLTLIAEREADGRPVDPEDAHWRRHYLARRDELVALIHAARAEKTAPTGDAA